MTNDSTGTTLQSFSPTSIDDMTTPSPETVVDEFEALDPWRTAVTINNGEEQFLVGRQISSAPKTFEVYYDPASDGGTGLAGTLSHKHHYDAPEDDRVAFQPASPADGEDEEPANLVETMVVDQHSRSEQLSAVLPLIRDDLMETDWVVDPADLDEIDLSSGHFLVDPDEIDDPAAEPWLPIRGDSGYGEWCSAMVTLADFLDEAYDDAPFELSGQTVMKANVTHSVARYPFDGERLLMNADDSIADEDENPEALRTLLLDYAVRELSLETVDIEIIAATLTASDD